jgi:hypothetical protein
MLSEIFRLVLVIGALAIAIYMSKFLRHPETGKENYQSFFWLFVAFALHHAALSFTAIFSEGRPTVAIIGYEIAIVFYFAVLYFAISALRQLRLERKQIFDCARFILVGFGMIAFFAYALDPVLPFYQEGFVVWGSNRLFGLISGLCGFAVGTFWAMTFLEGWSDNLPRSDKAQAILLGLAGLFLGISCVAFFLGTTATYFMVDYSFSFLGIGCAVVAVLFLKKKI